MDINYLKQRIKSVSSHPYSFYDEGTINQYYIDIFSVYATKIMQIGSLPDNLELKISDNGSYMSGTMQHENLGAIAYVTVVYDGTVPYNDKKCLVMLSEYY